MNRDVLHRLDEERRTVLYEGTVLEQLPMLTRLRTTDGSDYNVSFSALTDENADAAILNELEHHRGLSAAFEWKVYGHDQPSDLVQRLERHGFTVGPSETVMVLDLQRQPEWMDDGIADGVVRVTNSELIELYHLVSQEVFGEHSGSRADELRHSLETGNHQVRGYLAFDGDQPVSLGRLYTHPESIFGGLYGGGTITAFRGRGFYRAVVAARACDAAHHGVRYLTVDALPTSFPILQRMGFAPLTTTWPCEWRP